MLGAGPGGHGHEEGAPEDGVHAQLGDAVAVVVAAEHVVETRDVVEERLRH